MEKNLGRIVSTRQWLQGVASEPHLYATAAHEVLLWLAEHGEAGLQQLTEGLRSGRAFDAVNRGLQP